MDSVENNQSHHNFLIKDKQTTKDIQQISNKKGLANIFEGLRKKNLKNKRNIYSGIIIVGSLVVLLSLFIVYEVYFGKRNIGNTSSNNRVISDTQPSVTQTISPDTYKDHGPTSTIAYNFPTPAIESDPIKRELQKGIGDTWTIELYDVSPKDSNIIVFTADEYWSKYGIFVFDRNNKTVKRVWYYDDIISGRGAYYADNLALEFSSGGSAFYLNKTGTDLPSMFIFNINSEELYESDRDAGHPTWLSDNKLLFLSADYGKPVIFQVDTKSISETNLPDDLMHFRANDVGNLVLAYYSPSDDNPSDCYAFNLGVFTYPEEQLKTKVNSVLLESAKWVDSNTVSYKTVEGCGLNEISGYPIPTPSQEKILEIE